MERIAFVGEKFQIPKKPLNDPAPWPPSPRKFSEEMKCWMLTLDSPGC
jgi:hypothetical protein